MPRMKQFVISAVKRFGPHVLAIGSYVAYVLVMFAIMRELGVLHGS